MGLAVAAGGFVLDWRNYQRALLLAAIAVSWITVMGFAVFAVVAIALLGATVRSRMRSSRR